MGDGLKDFLLTGTTDPSSSVSKIPVSTKTLNNSDPSDLQKLQDAIDHIKSEWQKRSEGMGWWQRLAPVGGRSRAHWRNQLGEFLESTAVHVGTLVLLLIDLLATAVDILKTMHNKSLDLNSCTTLLESCQCVSHFEVRESLEFLYWIGIGILCLLLLNVGGLLLAFGASFFRHPGYVLDLVVLVTALCLEIFLDAETAGLLVILTLWRIVRVAHGIFEVTDKAMEAEIHKVEKQFEALESQNRKMQELLKQRDHRIAELEETQKPLKYPETGS